MTWLPAIGVLAAVCFLTAGSLRPRFRQPLLRPGLGADLMHVLVNGALLDTPVAATVRLAQGTIDGSTTAAGVLSQAPLWLQIVVLVLAGDLMKWSIHRLHHRIPCLWRLHRLHHSTTQLDSLSHARSHPLEFLLNRIPFLVTFVVILGIDLRVIAVYSALDLVQGLWVHSNTHVPTPWLNRVLATQEFHHWHHADDPAAVNKNFGGFLSVWDWLAGTAYCPQGRDVPGFGLRGAMPAKRYWDHLISPFIKEPRSAEVAGDRKITLSASRKFATANAPTANAFASSGGSRSDVTMSNVRP